MIGGGHSFQVSGLGRREPGSGVQVRVQVQGGQTSWPVDKLTSGQGRQAAERGHEIPRAGGPEEWTRTGLEA